MSGTGILWHPLSYCTSKNSSPLLCKATAMYQNGQEFFDIWYFVASYCCQAESFFWKRSIKIQQPLQSVPYILSNTPALLTWGQKTFGTSCSCCSVRNFYFLWFYSFYMWFISIDSSDEVLMWRVKVRENLNTREGQPDSTPGRQSLWYGDFKRCLMLP